MKGKIIPRFVRRTSSVCKQNFLSKIPIERGEPFGQCFLGDKEPIGYAGGC